MFKMVHVSRTTVDGVPAFRIEASDGGRRWFMYRKQTRLDLGPELVTRFAIMVAQMFNVPMFSGKPVVGQGSGFWASEDDDDWRSRRKPYLVNIPGQIQEFEVYWDANMGHWAASFRFIGRADWFPMHLLLPYIADEDGPEAGYPPPIRVVDTAAATLGLVVDDGTITIDDKKNIARWMRDGLPHDATTRTRHVKPVDAGSS